MMVEELAATGKTNIIIIITMIIIIIIIIIITDSTSTPAQHSLGTRLRTV